jgi:CRP-like cAMP-binding protein
MDVFIHTRQRREAPSMSTSLTSRSGRHSAPPSADDANQSATRNRLLGALSAATRAALAPHLERVNLELGELLAEAGQPWSHLYFPEGAAISELKRMDDGRAVEVGTIGNEGLVGLPVFLGATTCETDTIAPIPGPVLRAPVDAMIAAAETLPDLLDLVHRYTQAYLIQVAQNVACNQLHGLEQRCARWLLLTHDRVGGADVMPLKHEYLARILGVHRPAVTLVVGAFQRRGLINYRRGRMHLADRTGLEAAACECYRIVRQRFDRLL